MKANALRQEFHSYWLAADPSESRAELAYPIARLESRMRELFECGGVQTDITHLLERWSDGDETARDELIPLVYGELRRLSRSALSRQQRESLLQPTALVHEAWLRMVDHKRLSIGNRRQFYGLAAKIMRDILVDHLRRRQSSKRGGSQTEIALDEANPAVLPRHINFLVLDEALTRLGGIKSRYAEIAELRYMTGLSIEETAETLSVSHATIEREWGFARAWLLRELQREAGGNRG